MTVQIFCAKLCHQWAHDAHWDVGMGCGCVVPLCDAGYTRLCNDLRCPKCGKEQVKINTTLPLTIKRQIVDELSHLDFTPSVPCDRIDRCPNVEHQAQVSAITTCGCQRITLCLIALRHRSRHDYLCKQCDEQVGILQIEEL